MRLEKALGLALLGALVLATPSAAAVTIGSDLTADFYAAEPGPSCDAAVPCTWVSVRSPAALPQTAPFDGVVVRWRLRSQDNGYARLQVIEVGPMDYDTALRNAYFREPVHPGLNTFDDRLPIEAGATVGVDDAPGGSRYFGIARPGDDLAWFGQPLQPGYGPARPAGNGNGLELLMNADIEPDADHDGYGDETQDECPTDASTHGPCPPKSPKAPSTSPAPPLAPAPLLAPQPPFTALPPCTTTFNPRYRLRQVLRGGIVGSARLAAAGTVRVTALMGSTVAARGRASLTRPGTTPLTVHLTRPGERRLRRVRHGRLTLHVTFGDAGTVLGRETARVAFGE